MEFENLKNISISNLILIILDNRNADMLRKYAEIELRKRVKNVGWEFDDLLHFDDKAIQKRGLDINNYLISSNINMQKLMEIYFTYDWQTNFASNYLLFSEKHLCNKEDFGDSFFTKVCTREIRNLDRRLQNSPSESEKENLLLNVKITITYHAYNGAVWYKNIGIITWKQILNIYNEWLNGKKYCETIKRERNKVTSILRYEVLKRDHFTCKMCGATVKDGIKLQVDHIIPVSKGGKTTMSNLQTLCQRCNQGKSNKI